MTARSRTRNSVNISLFVPPLRLRRGGQGVRSFACAITQVAPVQLLPQPLEEALRAEPDQEDGPVRTPYLQALARLNWRAHLAIEGDEHLVGPRWEIGR